jgi:CheY-like chemotaxis protein
MNGKRILLVDDEPLVLRVLRLSLEKAGYIVETQPNGMQALESIVDRPPDVLITDIEMPEMDGKELCQRIERDFPNRQFMIFVATSLTSLEHRHWSNTVNNLNFLEKPLSARKLLAALNKYFENITALHSEGR